MKRATLILLLTLVAGVPARADEPLKVPDAGMKVAASLNLYGTNALVVETIVSKSDAGAKIAETSLTNGSRACDSILPPGAFVSDGITYAELHANRSEECGGKIDVVWLATDIPSVSISPAAEIAPSQLLGYALLQSMSHAAVSGHAYGQVLSSEDRGEIQLRAGGIIVLSP